MPAPAEEWVPEIDVFERDGKLIIGASVPGMKREDSQVMVEADLLTIKGRCGAATTQSFASCWKAAFG